MNQTSKSATCASWPHYAFHALFLGAMGVGFWFQWNPHSHVIWDTNCVVAFTLAATQILLYTLRFFTKPPGWRPPVFWDGLFFAVNFAIILAEFRCGVPYYRAGWIFWVFLGIMLVDVPRIYSLTIGIVATLLFVPFQVGWGNVSRELSKNWSNSLLPLAFPWILGLLIRRLVDTNGERAMLIDELQAAKKGLELARDREGELATLRERERLARDLHDTLGHQLVTLTVQLEAAQRLVAVDPSRASTMLEEMQKVSRSSTTDLRGALDNLRTSSLDGRPLTAALRALCTDASQRFALAVDCRVAEGAEALPLKVAEVLWCVAQEGLTNAGRHAQSRHIHVSLKLNPKEIFLQVADDGIGLPPGAENKPGHYGLRGLRERVEGLGGIFTTTTVEGGGTVIEARLPIIAG